MRLLINTRQLTGNLLLLTLIVVSVVSLQSNALADFTQTEPVAIDIAETMDKAHALIADGELNKATEQLEKVVEQDKSNADAWNLLGYSWRKLDKNRKSDKAYARALKIDPEHRGALEYQGELFIKTGKKDQALANLEKLKTLCPDGCEELDNLTRALAGKSSY